MKWFSIARLGVMLTLLIGMHWHLSRLEIGMDLVLEKVITRTADSIFAVVLIASIVAMFLARSEVWLRTMRDRVLFYFTLGYFILSVPIHVRTWFVPDNLEMLRLFPEWYSVFFLVLTSVLIIGWWNLKARSAE